MNNITKKAFNPIDQEEKDLMESIERDEWQPVKDRDVVILRVYPRHL